MKKLIVLLLFVSLCGKSYAFESKTTTGKGASYEEMQKMQNQDFDKLRNDYDAKARRECPRGGDGKIDTNSKEYKKLAGEYSKKHKQIRDGYVKQHPAADSLSKKNAIDGVKNTGSGDLRDIRSDIDWSADTKEAAKKKVDQWKAKKQKLDDLGYKVVNTDTGEILWRPDYDNDPRKIADTDAFGTTGGREATGAGGVADPKGATIDHDKKFTAGESSGNIKEQSKAVAKSGKETGRAKAPENKDLYKKAKSQQRYGDDVSGGITNLGDEPDVQAKKKQKFEAELKTELNQNKIEAAKTSEIKQKVRENLADSAKKAETAGDKKWNDAKNKANYDPADLKGKTVDGKPVDTKTTSEAIEGRRKEVDSSNQKQSDFNEKYKQDLADAKNKAAAEAKSAETKSAAPDADAKAKSSTPDADAPKVATDAPKVAADAPKVATDAPKVAADAPKVATDAPKVATDAPKVATDAPKVATDAPKVAKDAPKVAKDAPKVATDAPKVAADAPKIAAPDAPKVATDAPKVATDAPKIAAPDAPKVATDVPKIATPDAPKVKANTPDVGLKSKVKSGAGKVIGVGGDLMQGADIFGTAEDMKKDLENGDVTGAAKKLGTAIADEATGGLFSTGAAVLEKNKHLGEMQQNIGNANKTNQDAYDLQSQKKLREAGLSRTEVENLVRAKGSGDKDALDRKMKEMGVKAPEKVREKEIGPDDNWEERSLELQAGMKKNVEKAGEFLKQTGKDTAEIATGLTEKGVASEVANQTKENAKGWLETWRENRKAAQQEKDGHESMKDYFIKKGASPDAAEKATSDYEKGNKASGKKLSDMLDYKKDQKDAAEQGEDRKKFADWKKDRDEARAPKTTKEKDLRDAEGKSDETEQGDNGGDFEKENNGILDRLAGKKDERDRENAERSTRIASSARDVQEASTSGDQDERESKAIINSAGREAENTKEQAEKESAKADRDNSMGKTIGDAIEDSITKGGEALGGAIGTAGADKANKKIYEKGKKADSSETGDSDQTAAAGVKSTEGQSGGTDTQVSSGSDDNKDEKEEDGGDEKDSSGTGKTAAPDAPDTTTGKTGTSDSPNTEVEGGTPAAPESTAKSGTSKKAPAYELVTCPGCGRTLKAPPGTGIQCPYCVTLDCPVCGYTENYKRGSEPSSCPRCAKKARESSKKSSSDDGGGDSGGGDSGGSSGDDE